MSGGPDLEQRYRRVLRLLPGYYRDQWEDDMVAAFLDSWLTGDPEDDECVLEFCKPTWPEVASVAGLARPRALPHGADPRGAGHPPRPGRIASGPAHRDHAGAVRAVGLVA